MGLDLGFDKVRMQRYKSVLTRMVGDPVKMTLTVVAIITGVAAGAVYYPLADRIDQTRALVEKEQKRLKTIKDVESLRHEVAVYQPFLGAKADNNDWAEFLLNGSRETKVHFRGMEAKQQEKVGPYRAVSLAVEVEGTYEQLKAFVEWLEKSDRILRLETMRFEKMPGTVMMKVYVLGLVQKNG